LHASTVGLVLDLIGALKSTGTWSVLWLYYSSHTCSGVVFLLSRTLLVDSKGIF